MSSNEAASKIKRLNTVFSKALNVSVNGIDDGDLDECFDSTKNKLGGSIQSTFINKIMKAETNLQKAFKELCTQHDIENYLAGKMQPSEQIEFDDPLMAIVSDVQSDEMTQLTDAIGKMESEILRLTGESQKIQMSIHNELAASNVECQKLSVAVSKCSSIQ